MYVWACIYTKCVYAIKYIYLPPLWRHIAHTYSIHGLLTYLNNNALTNATIKINTHTYIQIYTANTNTFPC